MFSWSSPILVICLISFICLSLPACLFFSFAASYFISSSLSSEFLSNRIYLYSSLILLASIREMSALGQVMDNFPVVADRCTELFSTRISSGNFNYVTLPLTSTRTKVGCRSTSTKEVSMNLGTQRSKTQQVRSAESLKAHSYPP